MDQKVGASPGHFSWPRVLIGRHPRHTLLRLVLLVLASIGLFGYLLLPIRTQGISMLSTYELGSLKLVNAMAYTRRSPERGDVVAIRLAGRRVVYIKRVIGLPSERVRIDAGVVYTDEVALDEPYVRRRAAWTVEALRWRRMNISSSVTIAGCRPSSTSLGRSRASASSGRPCFDKSGSARCGVRGSGGVCVGRLRLGFQRGAPDPAPARRARTDGQRGRPGHESRTLVRMAKTARIAGYFTEDVTIDLGSSSTTIRGRGTLMAMAARIRVSQEGFRIELVDVQIAIAAEGRTATASMTVKGSGVDFATGDQVIDAHEIEMMLVKMDGVWLIRDVSAVSSIERPGAPAPIRHRP